MAIRQKICMGFNFVFCITYLHDLITQARSFLAPGRGPERPTCNEEAGALKVKGPVGGGDLPGRNGKEKPFCHLKQHITSDPSHALPCQP